MKPVDSSFVAQNKHIFQHRKCVFIVGAGISVPSGIPDFRSPTGIFSSLRQQLKINGKSLFTYNFGMKEGTREIYLRYIADLKRLCESSCPNDVHRFLATYPRSRVYTQNIDGLEERAGMVFTKNESTRGVYLHGNLSQLGCQYCGYKQAFGLDDADIFAKAQEIECRHCLERQEMCLKNNARKRPVGMMHPMIIHYQQVHPDGAFIGKMVDRDTNCDMLVVIGTSLKVEGVKRMVKMFSKLPGVFGRRFLVNLTKPTKEWEDVFDYFYEGDCSDFVEALTRGNPKVQTGIVRNKLSMFQENIFLQEVHSIKHKAHANEASADSTVLVDKAKSPVSNARASSIQETIKIYEKHDAKPAATAANREPSTEDSVHEIEKIVKRMSITAEDAPAQTGTHKREDAPASRPKSSAEVVLMTNEQNNKEVSMRSQARESDIKAIFSDDLWNTKSHVFDYVHESSTEALPAHKKDSIGGGDAIQAAEECNTDSRESSNESDGQEADLVPTVLDYVTSLPDSSLADLEEEIRSIVEANAEASGEEFIASLDCLAAEQDEPVEKNEEPSTGEDAALFLGASPTRNARRKTRHNTIIIDLKKTYKNE